MRPFLLPAQNDVAERSSQSENQALNLVEALMSLRASILGSTFLFSTLLTLCDAQAQPMRRMERDASRAEVGRSANQLADDMRDLQNFRQTLAAFDFAWQNRDAVGVN